MALQLAKTTPVEFNKYYVHLLHSFFRLFETLADPGGPWDPGTLTSRFGGPTVQFGGPSVQFKSKILALIFYFSKKFQPCLAQYEYYMYVFYILLVLLCSLIHTVCILLHYINSSHNLSCL